MYPYVLQNRNQKIFPIFGDKVKKFIFAGLEKSDHFLEKISDSDIKDQSVFNKKILQLTSDNQTMVISGYLENRERFFRVLGYDQMVEAKRFFHLGIDISLPQKTLIFAPLDAEIVMSDYETGEGNYGGRLVLRHEISGTIFYSLYGHLDPSSLLKAGTKVIAGTKIAALADFDTNGGYFHHLHLQVLTKDGFDKGFLSKGYCTQEQLVDIKNNCPDPTFLFCF